MNDERMLRDLDRELDAAGLRVSLLVRDLRTGRELGIRPDEVLPVASLAKVPLAVAVLERVASGEIAGDRRIRVEPGRIETPGAVGIPRFRHPVEVAVDDLLYLAVSFSDGGAADALFELASPVTVTELLVARGFPGIIVRHGIRDLTDTILERLGAEGEAVAHAAALSPRTRGGGHAIPQLDAASASVGSARGFAELFASLWADAPWHPSTASRMRELLASNVHRQRLAPDFSSDSATWSSKTGTLLHLRHEVGVVEHDDGDAFVVAALSESRIAARVQPAAEALLGRAARRMRDALRFS